MINMSFLQKIAELRKELPAYIFLMAFPQLISRICHADADVFKELVVRHRISAQFYSIEIIPSRAIYTIGIDPCWGVYVVC